MKRRGIVSLRRLAEGPTRRASPALAGFRGVMAWAPHPPLALAPSRGPASLYARRVKPGADVAFAALVLAFCLPLMLGVAAAIRLDSPGPVLFRQERTGRNGRRFVLYKFRTMHRDAERMKQDLLAMNAFAPGSPDFKIRRDPRITRIGRFLRRTSIDELPNFLNVLLGDLSVCGPRPTSFRVDLTDPRHGGRLAVRPGITGLWQVSGRADIDFEERVALDLRYAQQLCFLMDASIVLRTAWQCVRGKGAY